MKCKQKQEKRREKREGKEEVEKSENILSIVISKKCGKTRRELNGACLII